MRRRTLLATAGLTVSGVAGCAFADVGEDGTSAGSEDTVTPVGTGSTPTAPPGAAEPTTEVGLAEDDEFEVAFDFEREPDVWTIDDSAFGRTTEYAHQGRYSGGVEKLAQTRRLATTAPGVLRDGAHVDTVSLAWLELQESEGGGFLLENSDGGVEVFVGAEDSNWVVATGRRGDSHQVVGDGPRYERWVRVDLTFDWAAGTVTATFTEVETERAESITVDLGAGENVRRVALTGFSSDRFESGAGFLTPACAMYFDDILIQG